MKTANLSEYLEHHPGLQYVADLLDVSVQRVSNMTRQKKQFMVDYNKDGEIIRIYTQEVKYER